jgi:hypothetical protein
MVPYFSALFCRPETASAGHRPKNYACRSDARVRRFETAPTAETANGEVRDLPDKNTLSIFRTDRGFDHLDMLENEVVLNYVIKDLATLSRSRVTPRP